MFPGNVVRGVQVHGGFFQQGMFYRIYQKMPAAKRTRYLEDDHSIRYGTTTLLESVKQAWLPSLATCCWLGCSNLVSGQVIHHQLLQDFN